MNKQPAAGPIVPVARGSFGAQFDNFTLPRLKCRVVAMPRGVEQLYGCRSVDKLP